jgi:glycosyltransferase involved in cell wall biosynthesis
MNLLFVGRDFDRKGGRTVLEAARFLDSNRFAVTCVTSLQSLTSLSEQPGVHILAPVSKRSLHSLLLGSDLFLAPTKLEPYGLAVAEAMAFSLPVLASAVSAIPEILGSDNPGLLGEHPDGEELASAVLQFANDECLYATTALRNYLRAHLSFHWDRVAYTILNSALYHRLWV